MVNAGLGKQNKLLNRMLKRKDRRQPAILAVMLSCSSLR
jgi:hypothetical protein